MIEAIFDSSSSTALCQYRQISPPADENLIVPRDGEYFRILHDFELDEYKYKPRQFNPGWEQQTPTAVPSTRMMWGCRPSDFVPMKREWQFWLYELLEWASDRLIPRGDMNEINSLSWAYANLIANHRAFTDQHAPENGFADYVTGRNEAAKPYEWKSLHATGNIVKRISHPASATAWHRTNCYAIEALNLSKPPPKLGYLLDKTPYLIGWATEQGVTQLPDGQWVVSRFPQLRVPLSAAKFPEVGTPFPVVSRDGVNYIKKTHVVRINNGVKYSPYVPVK